MKLLLNCDQVFEILTRGPFPTGDASDDSVEQHLRACHECRQLAEALRPAVSLLHEAVAAEHAMRLPEYQGSLPEPAPYEEEYAGPRPLGLRQIACTRRRPKRQNTEYGQILGAMRLIAASVLIVALGTLAWGLAAGTGEQHADSQIDIRPEYKALVTLASYKLPAECFPQGPLLLASEEGSDSALAAIDKSLLRCCTECHNAATKTARTRPVDPALMAVATHNCAACHSNGSG